ncbi:MAG: zinc ribbon domain-containing protein, partial [Candidatus Omnitrophica bacterium]|nr:zinc ribbon domain-containing protein [Candidatus Omnitrophota bacterium]
LTEAQMKELFGWVQSSKMASVYVHLSGRNVDNALLQIHGLAKEEDKKETVLKLKKCPRCQDVNDPTSQFCKKCGSPLDIETMMKLEENRKKYEDFVFELLKRLAEKDPKVKEEFVSLAKEKNMEDFFKED